MFLRLSLFAALFFVLFTPSAHAVSVAPSKEPLIAGWVENVYVEAIESEFKAKLDTGAKTSSLRADVIKLVRPPYTKGKKKPKRHVIFQVADPAGKISTLERRLVRWVLIKDRKGGLQRRPVVRMEFCVAGKRFYSEVNLSERKDMIYPVLIGRNMLQDGNIVVDTNQTFTVHAPCPATHLADPVKEDE